MVNSKIQVFNSLRKDILRLQGMGLSDNLALGNSLGPMASAFPNHAFPLGSIHEMISLKQEEGAATAGFMTALLSLIMGETGAAIWISSNRQVFPISLKAFAADPDRFIFIDVKKERDVIWAIDEALKCSAIAAVVGEIADIDFKTSRRLQLDVERTGVTGFIVRKSPKNIGAIAAVSRWRISSLPSHKIDSLPGIGFPKWRVELSKIKNGKPGSWDVIWKDKKFHTADSLSTETSLSSIPWQDKRAS